MSYRFVKRQNAIGWDWYLESDDCSSLVSPLAKEVIETLEAENSKLRELVRDMWDFSCVIPDEPHTSKEELDYSVEVWKRMRELGVEVDG